MKGVDLPAFQSKFLWACAEYLQERGVTDIVPFARIGKESFFASWDSGITEGLPSFFLEDGGWCFDGRNDDAGVLGMDVKQNGEVTFRSLDGESVFLKFRIETPEELIEAMDLFKSLKQSHLNSPRWASTPLSAIIEQIFLVVPGDGKDLLVILNAKQLSEQQPQLWHAIKTWCLWDGDDDVLANLQYVDGYNG